MKAKYYSREADLPMVGTMVVGEGKSSAEGNECAPLMNPYSG